MSEILTRWQDPTIKQLQQENERLKKNNQAMQEEMARTWEKLDKTNNIIKEVREYIGISEEDRKLYDIYDVNGIEILEILDKENKDE